MKNNSRNIFSSIFFVTIISKVIYSEQLPIGSTIYYSRNTKCAIYKDDDSKICLENGDLYKLKGETEYLYSYLEFTNYSESNYYELNLYKIKDDSINIHVIITYFLNTNELIFKYYSISINNNNINSQTDFTYYNESLKPINKGINCQTRDGHYQFICFYLNKDKEVVQMDINPINNTHNVSVEFQFAKINNPNDLDSKKTIIMSSLFKDKYKFYFPKNDDKFYIYMRKNGIFEFSDNSNNEIGQFEFNGLNSKKIFIFGVFNENSVNEIIAPPEHSIITFIPDTDLNNIVNKVFGNSCHLKYATEEANIYFLKMNQDLNDFLFPENEHYINIEQIRDNTIINHYYTYISEETNRINGIKEINKLDFDIKKDEILGKMKDIMNDVDIEKTYEYKTNDFNILIYPINSELIENKTHIDIADCEYDLKQYHQLSNESIIAFFQLEIINENERSLINQVEYQAFDQNRNLLDISKCNNSNIKIH